MRPISWNFGSTCSGARLRNRFWNGDTELADAIEAALGQRQSALTPLSLDPDFLADALTEPAGSIGYLDLVTGVVLTETMLDLGADPDEDLDLEDTTRWLPVPGEGSNDAYRDMQTFIATVSNPELAQHLADAIDGRGAFRRFYHTIASSADDLTRWQR